MGRTLGANRLLAGSACGKRHRGWPLNWVVKCHSRGAAACGTIWVLWRANVSTPKEDLTRLIQSQPDDSSPDEIVRELAFHVMIERGLADSDAKRTISNEEMERRIRSWPR